MRWEGVGEVTVERTKGDVKGVTGLWEMPGERGVTELEFWEWWELPRRKLKHFCDIVVFKILCKKTCRKFNLWGKVERERKYTDSPPPPPNTPAFPKDWKYSILHYNVADQKGNTRKRLFCQEQQLSWGFIFTMFPSVLLILGGILNPANKCFLSPGICQPRWHQLRRWHSWLYHNTPTCRQKGKYILDIRLRLSLTNLVAHYCQRLSRFP